MEKGNAFQQMVLGKLNVHVGKKKNLVSYKLNVHVGKKRTLTPILYHRHKRILGFNVKHKTTKPL